MGWGGGLACAAEYCMGHKDVRGSGQVDWVRLSMGQEGVWRVAYDRAWTVLNCSLLSGHTSQSSHSSVLASASFRWQVQSVDNMISHGFPRAGMLLLMLSM